MNVLVDTSVWSLSLRRAKRVDDTASKELAELIGEGRVAMMGPIRQELLSGIKTKSQFDLLRDHLRAFSDLALEPADYEGAAEAFNRCRERGIQGSNTDFLICSVALRREFAVYTTDNDFLQYGKILEIKLHEPRR
ncbi:MAG: PIN domain-containing protein [Myxococcota bacterium]|jgi:predicted nucleic acid-binding protein|nr:PIN domain-containing protein [Myxococcota bacterium]